MLQTVVSESEQRRGERRRMREANYERVWSFTCVFILIVGGLMVAYSEE